MNRKIQNIINFLKKNISYFLIAIVVCLLGYILLVQTRERNVVDDKKIVWSPEWRNIKGETGKITEYSGSSFIFAFRGSKSLHISLSTLSEEQNVKLQVNLNGRDLFLENPNINQKEFAIKIPAENRNDIQIARVTWFCTGSVGSCENKIQTVLLDDGWLLDVPEEKKRSLAILGDSVSLARLDKNYSAIVANQIGYRLHNASVWGGTVGSTNGKKPAIFRYQSDIISYKPDLVIIFMGINDVNQRLSTKEFKDSYEKIVEGIISSLPQAKILTVGMLQGEDSSLDSNLKNQFNAIIQDIASRKKIFYLNSNTWLSADDYDDQFHPNISGQEKIAKNIINFIVNVVNK